MWIADSRETCPGTPPEGRRAKGRLYEQTQTAGANHATSPRCPVSGNEPNSRPCPEDEAAGARGGGRTCETNPIRTTGGAGGMRKAPKRGHRVTSRTLKHRGPPASHGLLPLEILTHSPFIESHGANAVCAIGGFLAVFRYNRSMVSAGPLHLGLTLPFFPDSSPGPTGAFPKGNYPIQNTHETAEPFDAHRQSRWLTELQFPPLCRSGDRRSRG